MSDDEFLDKYDTLKPRHNNTNIVFYGHSTLKSAAAVELAQELGFKWSAYNI